MVLTAGGRRILVRDLAEELSKTQPQRWTDEGRVLSCPVYLPEASQVELLLVVHWKTPDSEPLMLLVSPQARQPGRTAMWFARAYRRRWAPCRREP